MERISSRHSWKLSSYCFNRYNAQHRKNRDRIDFPALDLIRAVYFPDY